MKYEFQNLKANLPTVIFFKDDFPTCNQVFCVVLSSSTFSVIIHLFTFKVFSVNINFLAAYCINDNFPFLFNQFKFY